MPTVPVVWFNDVAWNDFTEANWDPNDEIKARKSRDSSVGVPSPPWGTRVDYAVPLAQQGPYLDKWATGSSGSFKELVPSSPTGALDTSSFTYEPDFVPSSAYSSSSGSFSGSVTFPDDEIYHGVIADFRFDWRNFPPPVRERNYREYAWRANIVSPTPPGAAFKAQADGLKIIFISAGGGSSGVHSESWTLDAFEISIGDENIVAPAKPADKDNFPTFYNSPSMGTFACEILIPHEHVGAITARARGPHGLYSQWVRYYLAPVTRPSFEKLTDTRVKLLHDDFDYDGEVQGGQWAWQTGTKEILPGTPMPVNQSALGGYVTHGYIYSGDPQRGSGVPTLNPSTVSAKRIIDASEFDADFITTGRAADQWITIYRQAYNEKGWVSSTIAAGSIFLPKASGNGIVYDVSGQRITAVQEGGDIQVYRAAGAQVEKVAKVTSSFSPSLVRGGTGTSEVLLLARPAGQSEHAVYKSMDYGETFQNMGNSPFSSDVYSRVDACGLSTGGMAAVALKRVTPPANPEVYVSVTTDCENWSEPVKANFTWPATELRIIQESAAGSSALLVTDCRNTTYRSLDLGETWATI